VRHAAVIARLRPGCNCRWTSRERRSPAVDLHNHRGSRRASACSLRTADAYAFLETTC
jgi:hypothetical protein